MFKCIFSSETETKAFAQALEPFMQVGDIITLHGNLGAGKSTFARALLQALGTKATHLPSPTYTIAQFYDDCRLPTVHLDCYRLSCAEELLPLGIEDYQQKGLCLAEWPKNAEDAFDTPTTLSLMFSGDGFDARTVEITYGPAWQKRAEALQEQVKPFNQ